MTAKAAMSQQRFTLEEAFDYFCRDALNDERALRAVAFLLTYCSDQGNESLNGNAANGLARILELCAAQMAK